MFIFVYNVDLEREIFPSVFIPDPKANQSGNGHKLQTSFFFGAFGGNLEQCHIRPEYIQHIDTFYVL